MQFTTRVNVKRKCSQWYFKDRERLSGYVVVVRQNPAESQDIVMLMLFS